MFSSSNFLCNCCPECKEEYRIEKLKSKHVGKTHGVLTVLDFDHFKDGRAFLKCKCSRCGKETVVRDDRFGHTAPQSCEHCYYDLLGTKTHDRYMKMYNFTSDEEFYEAQQIRMKIYNIKQGAKDRDYSFELSDEETRMLITSNCYYCNKEQSMGIDRVNSSIGYIKGDVVPCCGTCNIMKNAFSQETFLTQIHKIYNNLLKSSSTTIPEGSTSEVYADGNIEHPEKDGDIV